MQSLQKDKKKKKFKLPTKYSISCLSLLVLASATSQHPFSAKLFSELENQSDKLVNKNLKRKG
jgi:hypothetical protein